jgi:hypothetical protein
MAGGKDEFTEARRVKNRLLSLDRQRAEVLAEVSPEVRDMALKAYEAAKASPPPAPGVAGAPGAADVSDGES